MLLRRMTMVLGFLAMTGCTVVSTCDDGGGGIRLFGKDRLEQKLETGVKEYEEGNYVTAGSVLEEVADAPSASRAQKIRANKYLAFIDCISSHEKNCRDHFQKVLELNQYFTLSPAEVGHPIWGPVFANVKSKFVVKQEE